MNYEDLDTEQRKQVRDQSGYSHKQLKEENPYFIRDYDFADEMIDQFQDIYGLPDGATIYIDKEHLADEWGMDYTDVTIDGQDYKFRSW